MLVERGSRQANTRKAVTWTLLGVVALGLFAVLRHVRDRSAQTSIGAHARTGRVTKVLDGDTIIVEGVGTVRYLGIDTPELHHPRKPVQRLADQARVANLRLVGGSAVRLVTDVEVRDAYGRLLAYVYRGEAMVNKKLVRQGLARSFPFAPNLTHAAEFAALERRARRDHLGLWGTREGGPPSGTLASLRAGP